MDLFNDIGKMFVQASRSMSPRREDPAEDALAAAMRETRDALEQAYAGLGRACYDACARPEDCVSPALHRRIRDLEEKLGALITAQTRPERLTRCPGCGSMQEKTARFCSACGRLMPDPTAEKAKELEPDPDCEYCPKCGAMLSAGAVRCDVCGRDLSGAAPEPAEANAEISFSAAPAREEPDYSEVGEDEWTV